MCELLDEFDKIGARAFLLSIGVTEEQIEAIQYEELEQYLSSKAHICELMGQTSQLRLIMAKLTMVNLTQLFDGDFIPIETDVVPSVTPCFLHDVFLWSDEAFIMGTDGAVYYFDGSLVADRWVFNVGGHSHYVIGSVTADFYNEIRGGGQGE